MNENIDLTKILANVPKGTKLYSPIIGECEFYKILLDMDFPIIVSTENDGFSFTKEGCYFKNTKGECLLFPSREQRDWSKFVPPFAPKEGQWYMCIEDVRMSGDGEIAYNKGKAYLCIEDSFLEDEQGEEHHNWDAQHFPKYFRLASEDEIPAQKERVTLHPFDRVLVRDNESYVWVGGLFSNIKNNGWKYQCAGCAWHCCIPYNEETAHLIGTSDKPEKEYEIIFDKSFKK